MRSRQRTGYGCQVNRAENSQRVVDGTTPLLISLAEVEVLLGVSRTTLWRLLRDGQMASVKVGRRTKVVKADVDDFIERLRAQAAQIRQSEGSGHHG